MRMLVTVTVLSHMLINPLSVCLRWGRIKQSENFPFIRDSEMVLQVKALAAKSDNFTWIPRTCIVDRVN